MDFLESYGVFGFSIIFMELIRSEMRYIRKRMGYPYLQKEHQREIELKSTVLSVSRTVRE